MKILIIGAGVLGGNLTHSLCKIHDLTILARNNTYNTIKEKGLIIQHKLGRKTIYHIKVIEQLNPEDIYDAIFVAVRYSQIDSILPTLISNQSKNIIFVGNNMTAEKYENLDNKNVLFAFFSAAGKKVDDHIESICLNKITIGRCDNQDISNPFIDSIFQNTKIKYTIENKMNDYLKSHGCSVLPLVFASYRVNGNLKLLKNDKEYSLKIMDAIIEGYDVLKQLGYEILPKKEYEDCTQKKSLWAFLYRFIFSNFIGKICISDHAMNAKDEFIKMNEAFEQLKNKTNINTKVYDELKKPFIDN